MARTKNRGMEVPQDNTRHNIQRWNVGKYIRLSKEDMGKSNDDSNSIINQRKLLDEYCNNHADEFINVSEYTDDGYSGTDTNREQFQKLIADVMSRNINCVIVKDLSRLSRNYSDAGSLIENLFVQLNIRFISLTEGIDSYINPDSVSNLIVPITNVINDNFCYQTSKKIRQVLDMKRRNGEFIGGFAVYGYIKDPNNKNSIIIDEEAAEIIRCIYTWFIEGMSKNAIVRSLNARGILCPADYKKSKGMNYHNPHATNRPLWSAKTIHNILKNRVYAGDMVQGRQRVKSYKVHKQEQVPESEWYIVENTHEPIIARDVFEKVQSLLKRDTSTAPQKNMVYLFSGFLRCADCGKAMTRSPVRSGVYYYCRTYKDHTKAACTKHSIKHNMLEAAVLYAVQQQVYLAVQYSKTIEHINSAPLQKSQSARLTTQIAAKEKELTKLLRYKQSIYQDWKDGEITHSDYRHMSDDYEHQINSLCTVLDNLAAERTELENGIDSETPCLVAFRKFENIGKLTREVLVELIDKITVYENGNIRVKFRFADELQRVAEFIKINTQSEAV